MAKTTSDCSSVSVTDTIAEDHQHIYKASQESLVSSIWRRKKTVKHVVAPVLVIHGGAGTFTRDQSSPERKELYRNALRLALLRGHEVLQAGGEAMDAATAAVATMEGEFQVIHPTNLTPGCINFAFQ